MTSRDAGLYITRDTYGLRGMRVLRIAPEKEDVAGGYGLF